MKKKLCKIISVLLVLTLLFPVGVFAMDFEDVLPDDWFYPNVTRGLHFGLIEGVVGEDGFHFEPNRSVTRAEFITMLGRFHEYRNETIGTPGEGLFYERYLAWAVEMGIVQGNENGDLMPYAILSREQMVVIMHRYLVAFELWEYVRYGGPVTMMPFDDHPLASYWAQGIIEGFRQNRLSSGRYFRPLDDASRVEALGILITVAGRLGL